MHSGFKLFFTKVDAGHVNVENIHSEHADYFSPSSAASPLPQPPAATRYFLGLTWKYLGCLDRRAGYDDATVEAELELILGLMDADDLSFIRDLPVGESISTKLLPGTQPDATSDLSLEHQLPNFGWAMSFN